MFQGVLALLTEPRVCLSYSEFGGLTSDLLPEGQHKPIKAWQAGVCWAISVQGPCWDGGRTRSGWCRPSCAFVCSRCCSEGTAWSSQGPGEGVDMGHGCDYGCVHGHGAWMWLWVWIWGLTWMWGLICSVDSGSNFWAARAQPAPLQGNVL